MKQTMIIAPCDGSDRAATVHLVAALRILSSLLRASHETRVDLSYPDSLVAIPKGREREAVAFTESLQTGETVAHAFIRSLVGSYRPHERNVRRPVLIPRARLTPSAFADAFELVLGQKARNVTRPIAKRIAAKAIENFRDAEALPLSSLEDTKKLVERKMKKRRQRKRIEAAA